ncbi:bifunctional diguanylate cyclase/phosphodiesterase [Oceanimonas marisflavi]|uniref:bifunctional diguanylate cyclase/phosphodiesterase n=1 Tax=Oceanimonas marisflavi TaxID=2059724 RepID=UPI000D2F932C|nr:bifunctional diguanylate cyclase/phosphodiesterase [Oceanimonas marisflavi]
MFPLQSVGDDVAGLIAEGRLYPLFQPIMDVRAGRLLGHEALIRGPAGHRLERPVALFAEAGKQGLLSELDLACRQAALHRYHELNISNSLFINVNPNVLLDKRHPRGCTRRLAEALNISPERIVIELSEQHAVQDTDALKKALRYYRQLGFRIAIDDLGAGYSGLKLWSEIAPDFIKIDRHFIHQINQDPVKREFVQSIAALARSMNSAVIAEGIETRAELEQLKELGIHYCQGFWLGRPEPTPITSVPAFVPTGEGFVPHRPQDTVESLARTIPAMDVSEHLESAFERLLADNQLYSIPVLAQGMPVGMLHRSRVMELYSTPFGRALNANKPVTRAMDTQPVIVDRHTPLERVSHLITDDDTVIARQHFIITHNGHYHGLGSVRGLLRTITEQRLLHARYANPLTQLPGNVPIYREIDEALRQQRNFYVAYFDLNHFKPYNDVYGYAQGDKVLQWVARLLLQIIGGAGQFLGHVGGDDFVAVFDAHCDWRQLCSEVIYRFDEEITGFYKAEDRLRRGMVAPSRNGELQRYSLLGIAIGVVHPDPARCHSHDDVALLASAAKHAAKCNEQSGFCFSPERAPHLQTPLQPPLTELPDQ